MMKRWITITITNNYFEDSGFEAGRCDVEVVPAAETRSLLEKAGVMMKKQDACKWVLLKPEAGEGEVNRAALVLTDAEQRLRFYLRPLSEMYHFYAGMPEGSPEKAPKSDPTNDPASNSAEAPADAPVNRDWMITKETAENGLVPKVYLEVTVSDRLLTGTTDIRLTIPVRAKYWDVVLTSKHNRADHPLELREAGGRLTFSVPQTTERLTGGEASLLSGALHCISDAPVPLRAAYSYKISLWEKREKGDVLLSSHIPHPGPDSISVINAKEMIASYFYY